MGTPAISVICVTKRSPRAIPMLAENLNRQTLKDFEVIIADEYYAESNDINDYLQRDIPTIHFHPRARDWNDVWNINKAYNDCLDRATGELLVFLQDFIWISNDGLSRFWNDYQVYPTALITGCGHKAKDGLDGISEEDRRVYGPPGLALCDPVAVPWELNWSSCPRNIMPRFDERMDAYYGGENVYIQKKATLKGALSAIDRDNRCIGYSQEECGGRPENWEKMHANKDGRLAAFLKHLDLTAI